MAESKYSEELKLRGFTKMPFTSINRQMKRKLQKVGAQPTFTQSTEGLLVTYATDEMAVSWVAAGLINLSDLGFKNSTVLVHADMEKIYGRNKSKKTYH